MILIKLDKSINLAVAIKEQSLVISYNENYSYYNITVSIITVSIITVTIITVTIITVTIILQTHSNYYLY